MLQGNVNQRVQNDDGEQVGSPRFGISVSSCTSHQQDSEDNERNRMDMTTPFGHLAVTQIAGAIARRIVCDLSPGDHVQAGDRLGLIRFGSRVDLFLPLTAEIKVHKGDRVRSARTVMARFAQEEKGAGHVE